MFRIKKKPDGTINTYKARFIVKEFHQQAGIDYQDTFSLVAKPVTIRVLLSLVSCSSIQLVLKSIGYKQCLSSW